jgi:hypothetical protein
MRPLKYCSAFSQTVIRLGMSIRGAQDHEARLSGWSLVGLARWHLAWPGGVWHCLLRVEGKILGTGSWGDSTACAPLGNLRACISARDKAEARAGPRWGSMAAPKGPYELGSHSVSNAAGYM